MYSDSASSLCLAFFALRMFLRGIRAIVCVRSSSFLLLSREVSIGWTYHSVSIHHSRRFSTSRSSPFSDNLVLVFPKTWNIYLQVFL